MHMATYGPGIDQSQHAKSVCHIIMCCLALLFLIVHGRSRKHLFCIYLVLVNCFKVLVIIIVIV